MTGGWRGALGLCLRRCLRVAAFPTLLAALLSLTLHHWLRPQLGAEAAPGAASIWLALPLAAAASACALSAVRFWPTFAPGRPGRQWVDRLQRDRLGGRGGAVLGALLAQLALTLPLALGLAAAIGAPGAAHAHVGLQATGTAVLDPTRPRVTFAVPDDEPMRELVLRPLVGMPTGEWIGTSIDVLADGESLGVPTAAIVDSRQVLRVPFPPRAIRELTLVRHDGTVPLGFPAGTVQLLGANAHGRAANAAMLALVTLVPGFVALALGACCGLAAGLATVLAVVATALFLQFAGGLGGFEGAVLALLRGQWLSPAAVFPTCAPSLAVGCLAMIATMLLAPRRR